MKKLSKLQESGLRKIVNHLNEAQNAQLTPEYQKLKKLFDATLGQAMNIYGLLEEDDARETQIVATKFEDQIIGPLGGMIDDVEFFEDYAVRFDKVKQAKWDRGKNRVGLR